MVDIELFVERLNRIESFLKKKAPEMLMKHERKIVELNNAQLVKGKGTDGDIMQRGYSAGYASKRRKKGLQTNYVDLKYSGKYQDSRKGVKAKGGIDIKSGVDYEKYLRGNYPKHIGLTKENAESITDLLSVELAKDIKQYLIK